MHIDDLSHLPHLLTWLAWSLGSDVSPKIMFTSRHLGQKISCDFVGISQPYFRHFVVKTMSLFSNYFSTKKYRSTCSITMISYLFLFVKQWTIPMIHLCISERFHNINTTNQRIIYSLKLNNLKHILFIHSFLALQQISIRACNNQGNTKQIGQAFPTCSSFFSEIFSNILFFGMIPDFI